jgi:Lrp/AsnC family leucine-responsive transcriptional regulator
LARIAVIIFTIMKIGETMLHHNGIDLVDRKILEELSLEARLPIAELGRRIKLSPSATAERVRRLESLQLIRGYRADINLNALGFSITAFVRLTCDGNRYRPFLKFIPTLDAVQECHHLTGGDAFLLKVVLSSVAQLEDLIEKLLPYGSPTTSMVLSTPLERKRISFLNPGERRKPYARPLRLQ